ncbi:hypothetical protein ACOMHN_031789 [Nucella lapillus]
MMTVLIRGVVWGLLLAVVVLCSHGGRKSSFIVQESAGHDPQRKSAVTLKYKGMRSRVEARPSYPCGEGVCRCRQSVANCSRVAGGLQYIPHLPPDIRYLYFSYNHLHALPATFFHNVTRLTKVDVSHNNISSISPLAFRPLTHLKFLFLSANSNLTYAALSPVLAIASLQELDVMSCGLGSPLPADLFRHASLPRLRKLLMHANDLGDLALSTFQPLPALRELGLATNQITTIHADAVLPLEKINLDTNTMYAFPDTCNGTASLLPRLKTLLLQGNSLSWLPHTLCLPRVHVVALGKNVFSKIPSGTFSARNFPSLIQVSLFTMSTQIKVIEENAFSNPTLQRIDLAFSGIKFSSKEIHENSFANCPHLYNLELAFSKMDVDEERFVKLFHNLSSVSLLDMQGSGLTHLTGRMLRGFRNLTRLHLSRNTVLSLNEGLFDDLPHLLDLDLAQNQIYHIHPAAFSAATRKRLRSVDLSGNPFSCTCDLLWFRYWLLSKAALFSKSWTTYDCHNRPNISVQHFFLAEQACVWSQSTSILMDVVATLLIVILVVVFGLMRYRWHLRLMLYEAFRGQNEARRRYLQNTRFEYDVFVIYDLFDDAWVRKRLIPELEDRLHLRLCLQERDLDCSKPELDTISDCVEKSQKILMLFSSNFAQNQLWQFQLSMCLQHVLDHHDAIVIARLDDVTSRDMTATMLSVLRTTPYIQWAEGQDAVTSFWGRLRIALEEVLDRQVP